jgi:biotin carboxylase
VTVPASRPFAGRRLLVLGAGHQQVPLLAAARALGCRVIAADYRAENPGHAQADESRIVSTTDHEAVLAAARELDIDGVLTYGSDVSSPAVTYVAETLGLPGNPYHAGRLLQRKDELRSLQRRLGLPHPRFAAAASRAAFGDALRQADLTPPLLLKPADSSGSKGQTLVASAERLDDAFDRARATSRCGVVVAEQPLEPDLLELVGDVYVHAGVLRFGHYGHNHFAAQGFPRVPAGEIMPGFFGEEIVAELDRQMQEVVRAAGVRIGCLNFDAVVSGGRVHLLDVGLRCGGNYLSELIRLSSGVDLAAAAVHAAFGEEYPVPARHVLAPRWAISYIAHSMRSGRFRRCTVTPEIRDRVAQEVVFAAPGDLVQPYFRGDHGVGIYLLALSDREEALTLLPRLPESIAVEVY